MNERMQPIMDLIEDTIDAEITAQELADRAGYSLWHFCRMFQLDVGMPLMRYRLRRRLAHALYAIHQGSGVTDAALRYGFDTHAGFYKAFMREYGCSPTEYLKTHRALKPWRLQLKEERYLMLTLENWKKALTAWELENLPLQPVVYEPSGMLADNAAFAGDDWVLKAYRDPALCRRMIALAHTLEDAGLPAAIPLPLPGGPESFTYGAYEITLCRRIHGDRPVPSALLADPAGSGRRIGQTLRQLHTALDNSDNLPELNDVRLDEHILHWALPLAAPHLPAAFPADFTQRVQKLAELPRGVIHRDPNPDNLILMPDGRIGLIDFDLTQYSTRLFDLCYAATGVLLEVIDQADVPWRTAWPVFLQGILDGYGASEAERAAAPTVVLGIEVICIAAFAGSEKFKPLLDVNMSMLNWLVTLPA